MSDADAAAFARVDAFYRREIGLLQDRRYRDWLALHDPAIAYRVPVTTSTLKGLVHDDDALGYYDEDAKLLEARVQKLESRLSWVEQPPSRLRYFVQVLGVEEAEGGLVARSNLLLLQARWNLEQTFSGERTDTLVSAPDGSLRLRKRLVVLDRQSLGEQGLSVFF